MQREPNQVAFPSLTITFSNSPRLSTIVWRFLPWTSLPPSKPYTSPFFQVMRDSKFGHPVTTPEPANREKLAEEMMPAFNKLKIYLNFLARYELIFLEDMNIDEGKTKKSQRIAKFQGIPGDGRLWYKYQVNALMGTSIPSQNKDFSSELTLPKKRVYLSNGLGKFLPLYPFIIYEASSSYPRPEIFIMDSVKDKKLLYKSYSNHKIESSEGYGNFSELLETINPK